MTVTPASLQAFVTFCKGLRGDEKSESQTFLDRFFRAFGHEGAIEAGAEFEDRLKKASAKGKMGFADLVWRSRLGVPGVLIEMKKRGEDLSKHYAQVERYWMRITPNRPRYAMLCNFDEFWIFDFENQVDEPVGANLAQNPHGKPERWIIDFNDMSLEDASDYLLPFDYVKKYVKPERDGNRDERARTNWWRFLRPRPDMRKAIAPLSCYFAVPEVSKWAIFVPCPLDWLPGNNSHPVASDDFYILGILTSQVHRLWVKAQSSTLEDRTRYTHNTCFETFPFPQSPSKKIIDQIRTAAQELHKYRTEQMEKKQWGITQLYNQFFHEPSSQLFKLHAKLNQLVMQAYGFNSDDDILAKILELNLELAEKEKRGESVVGPWAPTEKS
jgi:hypothetical protein